MTDYLRRFEVNLLKDMTVISLIASMIVGALTFAAFLFIEPGVTAMMVALFLGGVVFICCMALTILSVFLATRLPRTPM